MEKHIEIKAPWQTTVDIIDNEIHIQKKNGFRTRHMFGENGLNVIVDLNEIESIEFKKAGMTNGFIRFVRPDFLGNKDNDPYSFQFDKDSASMKNLFEQLQNNLSAGLVNAKQQRDDDLNEAEKVSTNLLIDWKNKIFVIKKTSAFHSKDFKYDFPQLVSYHLINEGSTKEKHHRVTRGLVGGALLGGAGLVAGSLTGGKKFDTVKKLGVTINLQDEVNPHLDIILISTETKTDSLVYKTLSDDLDKMVGGLDRIKQASFEPALKQEPVSAADEIAKFKDLLDSGAITEEEFEAKKKQLLNL